MQITIHFYFRALVFFLLSGCLAAQTINSSPKIVNGSSSAKGQQPWMAALLYKGSRDGSTRSFCSGSLIAPQWVLTAAHCLEEISLIDTEILIGEEDIDEPESLALDIVKAIQHPDYDFDDPDKGVYDVGLIKLAEAVANEALPYRAIDFDEIATVYGFGLTEVLDDLECEVFQTSSSLNLEDFDCFAHRRYDPASPSRLQEVQMNLFSLSDCVPRYNDYIDEELSEAPSLDLEEEDFHPNELCAWSEQEQTAVCFGDSGGPIVQREGEQLYQVGVSYATVGEQCSYPSAIAFFVDLARVADFIEEAMGRDLSLDFDEYCPSEMSLNIDYGTKTESAQTVTLTWNAVDNAEYYLVRFATLPVSADQISELSLPVSMTEATLELVENDAIALSMQAVNSSCHSAMSPTKVIRMQP